MVDAIDRADLPALCDELGDLVFEAVFLAQLCAEDGRFTLADALDTAAAKLIRRHPHVFGEDAGSDAMTSDDVKRRWEQIKAAERDAAGQPPSLLGGIPAALPALLRAYRIGRRTATAGFDWDRPDAVLRKVREELSEVEAALQHGRPGRRRGGTGRPVVLRRQPRTASRRGARRCARRREPQIHPAIRRPRAALPRGGSGAAGRVAGPRWIGPGTASSRPSGPEISRPASYIEAPDPCALRTRMRLPSEQTSIAPARPVSSNVVPAAP